MGKKHISYRTRDRIRQADTNEHRTTFVPTISVERHIIIDSLAAEQFEEQVDKQLTTHLRRSQKKHYRVLSPNGMRLRLVENVQLSPDMDQTHETVETLAAKLGELLVNAPQWLKLPTGSVDIHEEAHPYKRFRTKRVVGFEPQGWAGLNARYARHDDLGRPLPLGLLADEASVCLSTLGYAVKTPYAPVVTGHGTMPENERRAIKNATALALPPELEWQDPVIYLRTGRRFNDVEAIPVRAPAYTLTAAA